MGQNGIVVRQRRSEKKLEELLVAEIRSATDTSAVPLYPLVTAYLVSGKFTLGKQSNYNYKVCLSW